MPSADDYRAKAAELQILIRAEPDTARREEYERLARGYMRLAEQADLNRKSGIVYEPPPLASDQPVQQQQQQQQPQSKTEPEE